MNAPKILIVEDKMIVAEDIKESLESMGFTITGIATSGEMAIKQYLEERPDIIFMDIRLKGRYTGIETSEKLNEMDSVPIVFLTAHSDPATLNAALGTHPVNYLVKPFDEKDLQIAVGLAVNRRSNKDHKPACLTYRHNGLTERISLDEILFAKASGSYTIIVTENRTYTVSFNLNQFRKKVNDKFVRVHRSYTINREKIDRYTASTLYIGSHEIPVSRSYRKESFGKI